MSNPLIKSGCPCCNSVPICPSVCLFVFLSVCVSVFLSPSLFLSLSLSRASQCIPHVRLIVLLHPQQQLYNLLRSLHSCCKSTWPALLAQEHTRKDADTHMHACTHFLSVYAFMDVNSTPLTQSLYFNCVYHEHQNTLYLRESIYRLLLYNE